MYLILVEFSICEYNDLFKCDFLVNCYFKLMIVVCDVMCNFIKGLFMNVSFKK